MTEFSYIKVTDAKQERIIGTTFKLDLMDKKILKPDQVIKKYTNKIKKLNYLVADIKFEYTDDPGPVEKRTLLPNKKELIKSMDIFGVS